MTDPSGYTFGSTWNVPRPLEGIQIVVFFKGKDSAGNMVNKIRSAKLATDRVNELSLCKVLSSFILWGDVNRINSLLSLMHLLSTRQDNIGMKRGTRIKVINHIQV